MIKKYIYISSVSPWGLGHDRAPKQLCEVGRTWSEMIRKQIQQRINKLYWHCINSYSLYLIVSFSLIISRNSITHCMSEVYNTWKAIPNSEIPTVLPVWSLCVPTKVTDSSVSICNDNSGFLRSCCKIPCHFTDYLQVVILIVCFLLIACRLQLM